ncbi:MAG TPA: type II secretion system protein, partial [Burkholderiales bacterium]|nr:type II secretion system protein [Burkholderiales bacterium]
MVERQKACLTGFTLIELLIVLAIIATLLTIAVPRYYASLDRSKEVVLKENLYQMRDAIGKYYGDKGKYPE